MLLTCTTGYAAGKKKVKARRILIQDVINGYNMTEASDKLWMLSTVSTKPVTLIINSPGGSIYAGFQFINAMRAAQKRGVKLKS
jgi:ATP-dependent protease ClpP protease subunit